jgi:small GTP-binding protein
MSEDYHYQFKIIVAGFQSVGKSSLITRYTKNIFNENTFPTQGLEHNLKMVDVEDRRILLNIWDTAGQARFFPIIDSLYRGADGAVLVFDITNRESFQKVEFYRKEVSEKCSSRMPIFILIGNKLDLETERQVGSSVASSYAQKNNMPYLETSSKTNENVAKTFFELSKKLLQRRAEAADATFNSTYNESIRLRPSDAKLAKKKKCC